MEEEEEEEQLVRADHSTGCIKDAVDCVSYLFYAHGVRQVHLVGQNHQRDASYLLVTQDLLQDFLGLPDPGRITAVHYKHQSLAVIQVVPPVGSHALLSSDVPHSQRCLLVQVQSSYVEPDGRGRLHYLF